LRRSASTEEAAKLLPDVPAIHEVIPGYVLPFWTGLYAGETQGDHRPDSGRTEDREDAR
jgi:hypothetical protein